MPTFPRVHVPDQATALYLPTGLKERGHTGIIQTRGINLVGWSWEETWQILNARNNDDSELMALVDYWWHKMVIIDITHPLVRGSGLAPGGVGTGTVLVKGAGQTGGSLITDGWGISTNNVVRAGDVIKIAGDHAVYRIYAAANSNGSGDATLNIVPNLRFSPADNAAVTKAGVTFRCIIWDRSRYEGNVHPSYYAGYSLTFTEFLAP